MLIIKKKSKNTNILPNSSVSNSRRKNKEGISSKPKHNASHAIFPDKEESLKHTRNNTEIVNGASQPDSEKSGSKRDLPGRVQGRHPPSLENLWLVGRPDSFHVRVTSKKLQMGEGGKSQYYCFRSKPKAYMDSHG